MTRSVQDQNRRSAKALAIADRLGEMHANRETLLRMLDEPKLDMMILALGIGRVVPSDEVTTDEWSE